MKKRPRVRCKGTNRFGEPCKNFVRRDGSGGGLCVVHSGEVDMAPLRRMEAARRGRHTQLEKTMLPAAPIIRLVDLWIRENEPEGARFGANNLGVMAATDMAAQLIWPGCFYLTKAGKTKSHRGRLTSFRKQKYISFDLADRILCKLGMVERWHDDPELNKLYREFDLAQLDEVKPKRISPIKDPNSMMYLDDPEYTFYRGQWRTEEGVRRDRKRRRERVLPSDRAR